MDAAQRLELLRTQATRLDGTRIAQLNLQDASRARDFALRVGPVYANFARQRFDREALDAMCAMLEASGARGRLAALFDGAEVNNTERRAALHTALRSDLSRSPVARDAHAQARDARDAMRGLVAQCEAAGI